MRVSHLRKDETGNTYGRLSVISMAGKDKRGQCQWMCHCSCGKDKIVKGDRLRQGLTKSCGCLRRELTASLTRLSPEELELRKTSPRTCSKCKIIYPPTEFQHLKHHWCRKCVALYSKIHNKINHRRKSLRDKYGITEIEYNRLLDFQNGLCAICRHPQIEGRENLDVDHNRSFLKGDKEYVRGLLCNACNVGIGRFKDDPDLVFRAWKYLSK